MDKHSGCTTPPLGCCSVTQYLPPKTQRFTQKIEWFELVLRVIKDQSEVPPVLEQIVAFCDKETHSQEEDLDEQYKSRKTYFTGSIGWVIPSLEMLKAIQQIQTTFGTPICDYGSGTGLVTNLLGLLRGRRSG